jgi:hypothetical protein
MIRFKFENDTDYIYFKDEVELAIHLRSQGVDEEEELSNEFIVNESYAIGEWDYVEEIIATAIDKYDDEGASAVFSYGEVLELPVAYCKQCEYDHHVIYDSCLVCGTEQADWIVKSLNKYKK